MRRAAVLPLSSLPCLKGKKESKIAALFMKHRLPLAVAFFAFKKGGYQSNFPPEKGACCFQGEKQGKFGQSLLGKQVVILLVCGLE